MQLNYVATRLFAALLCAVLCTGSAVAGQAGASENIGSNLTAMEQEDTENAKNTGSGHLFADTGNHVAGDDVAVDLALGDLVVTATGFVQDGAEVEYGGPYRLWQSADAASTVRIESGDHTVTLWDVHIDVCDQPGRAAFSVAEGASVRLVLEGSNTLRSGADRAGLQVGEGEDDASLTLLGDGSLAAYGGENAAGIGGGYRQRNGHVSIEGGRVEARGGEHGAGIGGGRNTDSYKTYNGSGGVIAISGGTVTAVGGGGGAGIGGGNHGDGGSITVTGGTVLLAQGGGGGAGIGSGLGSSRSGDKGPGHYTGGSITLSGDYVIHEALGGGNAAGIGGGMYGDSGTVRIRGGEIVRAEAGAGTAGSLHHGAAGIGGGYQGHCDIAIVGGAVIREATGSFSGAGIGSGGAANAGARPNENVLDDSHVFICSSYIYSARGGAYGGAGIGGGVSADRVTVTLCGHVIRARGGGGGAGIGSGLYDAARSYASPTELRLYINCGDIGGDSMGGGEGNDPGEVTIDGDEVEQLDVPGLELPDAEGYTGVYDGLAYSISVDLPGASITYSEMVDGDYSPVNPTYVQVGAYQVFYRARMDHVLHTGSEYVIITPLGDGGGGGAVSPPTDRGDGDRDPAPDVQPPDFEASAPGEQPAGEPPTEADEEPGKALPDTGAVPPVERRAIWFAAAAIVTLSIHRLRRFI